MNLREAATQVLDAYDKHEPLAVVMEDLRTALAEPKDRGMLNLHAELDVCKTTLNATTECWRIDVKHWTVQRDDMLEVIRLSLAYVSTLEARILKADKENLSKISKIFRGDNNESA